MLEFFIGTKEQRAAPQKVKDLAAEPNLTRRKKDALLDAKKLSKDLFKVRLRTAVLATACLCLLGGFCSMHNNQKPDTLEGLPNWLTVEGVSKMGRTKAMQAASAAMEWDNKFQCGRDVTIGRLENPYIEDLGAGFKAEEEETSEHGKIAIADRRNVRDIVLHAMTHACTPDNATPLIPYLGIPDGQATGYSGLKVETILNSGQKSLFILMEEGMAERNAFSFPGYTPPNHPGYEAIRKLTTQLLPLTDSNAHLLAKQNDVEAFVRKELNLPKNIKIMGNDIQAVMNKYQKAWDKAMEPYVLSNSVSSFNF